MTIRSRMSSIMGLIRPELLVLYPPLNSKNYYISLYLHYSIYKYQPISSKLGQNIYESKTSDVFDRFRNKARTTGVICP